MFDVEGKWPNKVEQTGSTLGLSEIRTADTPPVHIIHRQGARFSPLILPSASCKSNSFTILIPSPLRGVETPQQVQATSDNIYYLLANYLRYRMRYQIPAVNRIISHCFVCNFVSPFITNMSSMRFNPTYFQCVSLGYLACLWLMQLVSM